MLSRPFGDGATGATAGEYLGPQIVLGTRCHHLAFRSETVDWQVWIQDGPKPVIVKAVMAAEDEGGPSAVTILFSGWDTITALPDFVFSFQPPGGATKIDIIPTPVQPDSAADAAPAAQPAK